MRKKADWGADHERSTEAPEHGTEPVFPTSTREKKVANGKEGQARERERNRGVERAGAALISENLQFSSGVDTQYQLPVYRTARSHGAELATLRLDRNRVSCRSSTNSAPSALGCAPKCRSRAHVLPQSAGRVTPAHHSRLSALRDSAAPRLTTHSWQTVSGTS